MDHTCRTWVDQIGRLLTADAGCGFEVASAYELHLLSELGVAPEDIIYGTSVKPASHVKELFEYGVDRFAFDSLPELEKVADVAPGCCVYVRAGVNDSQSVFRFSEKFGAELADIVPLLSRASKLGLKPLGISFHVGSQAGDVRAWAKALESLRPVLDDLLCEGIGIGMLNLGGGYPCRYASSKDAASLDEIAHHTLSAYHRLPVHPSLILEPGRGVVANAFVLVSSVIARVERSDHVWLFLDAGCYNGLFEAMAYQGSTRYQVTSLRQSGGTDTACFALAGPTGDAPDVITREAVLPADINVGDKLAIHNVGAYSLSVTSRFNGYPKPEVYFV